MTRENISPITLFKKKETNMNKKGIRRMTPREWARLQGFSDKYKIIVSDVQAYKQFGNSVAIPAVKATGKEILKAMKLK